MIRPHIVILAAGAARRFGSVKALARIGDKTLVECALDHARSVTNADVTLVLGAGDASIRKSLNVDSIRVVHHEHWRDGLSATLKFALQTLPAEAPAVLVMLVDQPAVTAIDLQRLVDVWREQPDQPAAAAYSDGIGAPCILPRRIFEEVMSLEGDFGAKSVLQRMPQVSRVEMPQAAYDVDTPEDLERVKKILAMQAR